MALLIIAIILAAILIPLGFGYALGRNVQKGTLTKTGKLLNKLLDKIDKDHAIKSIE